MSTIISKNIQGIKTMVEIYNSADDVVKDCKERQITSTRFDNMQAEGQVRKSWHGVESYDEALEFLRTGYQPTVQALKEKTKATVSGTGKRISFKNEIAGFAPVVPLALKGVPNCMINTNIRPIKYKVIDVYYDMTVNCGVRSEQILENGQKLLGAILELEAQGYRFNLYAVQTYYNSDLGVDMLAVKVKDSSRPLDIKRISFPLTHTAFFRVIGFDWYSKTPKGVYRSGYGCGIGYDISEDKIRKWSKELFGNNAIYFSASKILNKSEEHLKEVMKDGGNNNDK